MTVFPRIQVKGIGVSMKKSVGDVEMSSGHSRATWDSLVDRAWERYTKDVLDKLRETQAVKKIQIALEENRDMEFWIFSMVGFVLGLDWEDYNPHSVTNDSSLRQFIGEDR